MDLSTVIILRALERLLGVAIGGFIAWLGYRLFIDIPTKPDSSGRFVLPGGTAIHLARVGPGVFFSLFGTAIVMISFIQAIDARHGSAPGAEAKAPQSSYSGMAPSVGPSSYARQELRGLRLPYLATLNRLPAWLRSDLSGAEREDVESARPQIKLAIMETIWSEDWGDAVKFREWVNTGGPAPADLKKAVEVFNQK